MFSLFPFSHVATAIAKEQFSNALHQVLVKVTLVARAILEGIRATAMAATVVELSLVDTTIGISHGSLGTFTHDVLSFKEAATLFVAENTLTVVQIIEEVSFVVVTIGLGVFALSIPLALLPFAMVDALGSSVDHAALSLWLGRNRADSTSILATTNGQFRDSDQLGIIVNMLVVDSRCGRSIQSATGLGKGSYRSAPSTPKGCQAGKTCDITWIVLIINFNQVIGIIHKVVFSSVAVAS
mmetsp:Transcript_39689/g.95876  ORF Transcript_39689/g.95876 Transcript_39689/m.95876 type:complete len:240 (+) Transcript_39689:142-861(+)